MPRKHKQSGKRRNRAHKGKLGHIMAMCAKDGQVTILDPLEYSSVFRVIGGRFHLGHDRAHAYDARGVSSGEAVTPDLLQITRDKASKLMAVAKDAAAMREVRDNLREERAQMQVNRLLSAADRYAFGWYRQQVPDQAMRSILCGSNNDKDYSRESDSLVICFRDETGRYRVATEQWAGEWSAPDKDGYRERVGVTLDYLPICFHNESEAQQAVLFAVKMGELERFTGQIDPSWAARLAKRCRKWTHRGVDMKQRYPHREKTANYDDCGITAILRQARADLGLPVKKTEVKQEGKRVRIPNNTRL